MESTAENGSKAGFPDVKSTDDFGSLQVPTIMALRRFCFNIHGSLHLWPYVDVVLIFTGPYIYGLT